MADFEKTLAAIKELSEEQREMAQEKLQELADKETATETDSLLAELLKSCNAESLVEVRYRDIHQFCSERKWSPEAKEFYYKRWLPVYLNETEQGREIRSRTIYYLVMDDYDTLIHAANEWKESGFSPHKLRRVQECAKKFADNDLGIYPDFLVERGKFILACRPIQEGN